jgi:hypothetical protein
MTAGERNAEGSSRNGAAVAPNPMHALQERAEAGDFATVLQFFTAARPGAFSPGALDRLLRRAIDQAGRQSPRQFADAAYLQTTTFLLYVLGRLQVCAMQGLLTSDAAVQMQRGHVPEDLTAQMLPMIERLSRLVGELNQAWASTARLWSLAEGRT